MKQLMKISVLLCLAAAFGFAETWTGKLIDANCKQDPVAQKDSGSSATCAPKATTTVFAIQTADGKIYRLDNQGNSKAATAMKIDPTKTNVTVSGSFDGQMVKVESIEMQ